ncbi:unnamed protein product [Schistocephalus solidus]|uniref:AMMECR1 domain-containing protein n=1 Tax=Schistocephalus solidus TaxID=70667 RepID=A0A183T8J4_SCHSO|nr:unnamed protein product [Schistocephalus solidus]
MGENLVGKIIKELQNLGVSQSPVLALEKLTRCAEFTRWEARCNSYLQEGFPHNEVTALNTRVLEQFVTGIRYPKISKGLLWDRPSAPEKAFDIAREEEILQAACEQLPRSLFSVTVVQPHTSRDGYTQTPWQP